MSIPSRYLSGDDEEDLFRLTNPDEHPDAADENVARKEEESLASSHYDDVQDDSDELAQPTQLGAALQEFSAAQLAEVVRLIEDIQNRREENNEG